MSLALMTGSGDEAVDLHSRLRRLYKVKPLSAHVVRNGKLEVFFGLTGTRVLAQWLAKNMTSPYRGSMRVILPITLREKDALFAVYGNMPPDFARNFFLEDFRRDHSQAAVRQDYRDGLGPPAVSAVTQTVRDLFDHLPEEQE